MFNLIGLYCNVIVNQPYDCYRLIKHKRRHVDNGRCIYCLKAEIVKQGINFFYFEHTIRARLPRSNLRLAGVSFDAISFRTTL